MSEKFNPSEFKSYKESPEDRKADVQSTQEGGFVSREAAQSLTEFQHKAERYNKFSRIFFQKLLGRDKKSAIDVAHEEAIKKDPTETARIEIRKIRESMPEELKKELQEALFEGRETVNYRTSNEGVPISAKGLDEAIKSAVMAGASYNWDTDWAVVELHYKGQDTDAQVFGVSNGWGYARPNVKIEHKGKEYSWVEVF